MAKHVRWFQSLAWKFFLRMAVAILIVLAGVLAVAYQVAEKSARSSAEGTLGRAAQILDRTFSQQTLIMDRGLEVFTQYSANQAEIEKAMHNRSHVSVSDTLRDNLPLFTAEMAVVVEPDGKWFSCTTDGSKQDWSDVGIVQRALHPDEAKAAGIVPPYRGFFRIEAGAFQGTYLGVARPLVLPGGHLLGAMLVGQKLDAKSATALQAVALPSQSQSPSHLAFLSHYQVLGSTSPDPALAATLTASPGYAAAKARVAKGERSEPLPILSSGRPHLAMLSPLRGADAADMEMAHLLLVPLDPLMAPFRTMQNAVLAAGAIGLVLALGLALTSSRGVTSPLARLTEATAALAEGERPEIPHLDSQDEVGYLTQAFRALLSELRAKDDLLAALESLRNQPQEDLASQVSPSRISMSAMDVDATVMVPSASQLAAGVLPQLQRKRLLLKEGDLFAGRYRIEGIVGKGGMGVVLKARDLQLDEDVAIKVIRPEHEVTAEFLFQIKQEIRLARKISHKHVLRTHDFGDAEGIPFVSMEFLKGVTLKQLVDDRGALPVPLVLRIGRQVAEGLEAAHAVGVVHRDVKPLNVLFDARGDVKIMDFGLAAPVAARGTNEEGQIFGTPRYMAPEQVRGEHVDPRTDLYALGIMLFELSAGRPPYDNPDLTELLRMHMQAPIPRVRDLLEGVPESLGHLIERLMAKEIGQRPSSATEVVEILKLIAAGSGETRKG